MSDSLANSAGWSWNGPNANQAWAPFDCEPSGDTTSTSRAMVAAVEQPGPVVELVVVDEGEHAHHPDADHHEGELAQQVRVDEVGTGAAGGAVDHQHAEAGRGRASTPAARGRGGGTAPTGRGGCGRESWPARPSGAASVGLRRRHEDVRRLGLAGEQLEEVLGAPRAPPPRSRSRPPRARPRPCSGGRPPGRRPAKSEVSALPLTWAVPVLPTIGEVGLVEAREGAAGGARCG